MEEAVDDEQLAEEGRDECAAGEAGVRAM